MKLKELQDAMIAAMKAVMAELKGKADGKVINQTVADFLK